MTFSTYAEDYIADNVLAITEEGVSLVRAAQQYGVPKSTLSDRIQGQGAQAQQLRPNRRISVEDEDRIKQWVLCQEFLGNGLSYNRIRKAVENLLQQRGDNEPLGANWVKKFINRHLELKTKKGRLQESVRFDAFTPKAVNWYFDILEDFAWIKPENIVNVDKGGIMAGYGILKYSTFNIQLLNFKL
jgi:hypothetical protein